MTALQFLRRSVGDWSSSRRYLFAPKLEPVNLVTEFKIDELAHGVFQVVWQGQTSGTMELTCTRTSCIVPGTTLAVGPISLKLK